MSITYYSANRTLDKNFGAVNFTPTPTMYIGLSSTAPSIDGAGVTEPSGNAYARVALTNDKTSWTSASNGSVANVNQISFVESTGNWGTMTHIVIYDSLSGGNLLYYEQLTQSRTIGSATTVLFSAGQLTVAFTNS